MWKEENGNISHLSNMVGNEGLRLDSIRRGRTFAFSIGMSHMDLLLVLEEEGPCNSHDLMTDPEM